MAAIEMEMSKTYQYRKVMKPMLERKRRARINKCLDELKDLMVTTLEAEGEHVTRLEKADILELTVTHLQKLKTQKRQFGNRSLLQVEGFRSGFIFAATEVSRTLAQLPGVNVSFGTQLMTHLGQRLNQIQPAIKVPVATPLNKPLSVDTSGYHSPDIMGFSPSSSRSSYTGSPKNCNNLKPVDSQSDGNVWRPW